jgi:WD40 repeat protein
MICEIPQGEDNFKKERFVLSVAYSPDGKRLACGSMDGTVGVFDTTSGKLLHTLDGHFKPVRALTFTPGKCEPRKTNCAGSCVVSIRRVDTTHRLTSQYACRL